MLPTATQEDGETGRAKSYSTASALERVFDDVLVSLDTSANRARIRDLGTGEEVYSDLTSAEAAEWMEMILTLEESDLWHNATASLNPLANAPEGWQPEDRLPPTEQTGTARSDIKYLKELARTKQEIALDGLHAAKYRVRVASVESRRPQSGVTGAFSNDLADYFTFDGYPQYWTCVDLASAVASERMSYHASRNWVKNTAKAIALGQAINTLSNNVISIALREGKKFVEGPDIVQAFLAAGMAGTEAMARGMTTALKTKWYNDAHCQGAITIMFPIPPLFNWTGGGGGGNPFAHCTRMFVTYEVSLDGGMTWAPITIERNVCVSDSQQ